MIPAHLFQSGLVAFAALQHIVYGEYKHADDPAIYDGFEVVHWSSLAQLAESERIGKMYLWVTL